MSCDLNLSFQNATGRLRTLRLEPWARHFIMEPGEKIEVVARSGPAGPNLRVVEASDSLLVYTEGCDRIRVIQAGIAHDLQSAYEVTAAPLRLTYRDGHPMWDRDLDSYM